MANEIAESLKDISPIYYSTFHKSPVALLMGRTDYFTTEEEVYQFFNGIQNKDKYLKFYETGHDLPRPEYH